MRDGIFGAPKSRPEILNKNSVARSLYLTKSRRKDNDDVDDDCTSIIYDLNRHRPTITPARGGGRGGQKIGGGERHEAAGMALRHRGGQCLFSNEERARPQSLLGQGDSREGGRRFPPSSRHCRGGGSGEAEGGYASVVPPPGRPPRPVTCGGAR